MRSARERPLGKQRLTKTAVFPLFYMRRLPGLRKQENAADMLGVNSSRPATRFLAEVTTAESWDPALLERIGAAIGEEAKDQGAGLILGSGANLNVIPCAGGILNISARRPIRPEAGCRVHPGYESLGHWHQPEALCRHFSGTGTVYLRQRFGERTLRELYLAAFEIAVKEGRPSTVICAYSKLNGIH